MRFPSPNGRPDRDDQLIPLVNVVLLMLIFFMVVGKIAPLDTIPINPPESQQSRNDPYLEQVLTISSSGRMELQELPITLDQLSDRITDNPAGSPSGSVSEIRIKADRNLPAAKLILVLDQLQRAGIERVQLTTQAPQR